MTTKAPDRGARKLRRRLGDRQNIVDSLNNLGWVALGLGNCAEARPLFEESLSLARELADVRHVMLAQGNLGLVALLESELEQAAQLFVANLELCREVGDKRTGEESLRGLALLVASRGRALQAVRLASAARHLRGSGPTDPVMQQLDDKLMTRISGSLTQKELDQANIEGWSLTFDEAVAYGLDEARLALENARTPAPSSG